jgi:hypothetical protein
MKKIYKVEVLVGTVYEAEIEADSLDVALTLAMGRDPEAEGWSEVEADRVAIIETAQGRTPFGYGVRATLATWGS